MLRILGFDTAKLSDQDVADGAELARRISQCPYVPGANRRRGKVMADWRAFVQRHSER
jgi:hypothetical protein